MEHLAPDVKDGLDPVRQEMNACRSRQQRVADRLEMLKQKEKEAVEHYKVCKKRDERDIEGQEIFRTAWNQILDEIELLQAGDLKAYEERYGKL
eukprot:scaffold8.g1618.t1